MTELSARWRLRDYVEMVRAVGPSYHPDTPSTEFVPKSGWVDYARFAVGSLDVDEYALTLRVFENEGWT